MQQCRHVTYFSQALRNHHGSERTSGKDPITNTAEVVNPIEELNPADNSDSDTDLVGLFADGMESVEPD